MHVRRRTQVTVWLTMCVYGGRGKPWQAREDPLASTTAKVQLIRGAANRDGNDNHNRARGKAARSARAACERTSNLHQSSEEVVKG